MDGFFWFKLKIICILICSLLGGETNYVKFARPWKGAYYLLLITRGLFSNSCHATIKIVQRKHKQKVQLDLTNFRKENLK